MGDDSKTDVNVKSEGTLVQEGDKIYWFPGTHQFKGVVVPKGHAVDLVEGIVGRKLSDDEFGLLFSVPVNGSKSVTIISTLVSDPSEPNYLKSIKSEVIGYIVSTRENRARHNYGDIIAKTAFYDTDGKQQGTPEYTYKDEPGLVSPWLDPIDLIGIGGAVVDLAKFTAKAFSRSSPKVIARSAPKALPKAVRQVTADEVELGIRPPTAAEFRKQIASFTRGEEAAGGRASGRISALDKGRGARPFYAKDPSRASTAAYWLMLAVRDAIPHTEPLAKAEFATIRERLIKIGARVIERLARIRIQLPISCPERRLFRAVAFRLAPSSG